MRTRRQYLIAVQSFFGLLFAALLATSVLAMERPYPGPFLENDDLLMVLIPHTPEQMAAFYEARGFPKAALSLIRDACFVTIHIENKSRQVIWLETANWRFSSNKQPLERIGKDVWDMHWDRINLPKANRSTFRWTQLPVQRDLQPGEPVGGNIVLDPGVEKFDLEANFLTGSNKRGGLLNFRFQDIECPSDQRT